MRIAARIIGATSALSIVFAFAFGFAGIWISDGRLGQTAALLGFVGFVALLTFITLKAIIEDTSCE